MRKLTVRTPGRRSGAFIVSFEYISFFFFVQIFVSPQVKRNVIITNKHDIYESPHEFPND